MPLNEVGRGVQTTNTEQDVLQDIHTKKTAGMSLRQIATLYGKPIIHDDIWRILNGEKFPKSVEKRQALGLAPLCPTCSQPIIHHRPQHNQALVQDKIHGTGYGRLGDIVAMLRRLETNARRTL